MMSVQETIMAIPPLRSRPYRRIKLMVVGGANQGKTSLLLNLTKKGKMTRFKEVTMDRNHCPLATVGVDLGDWEYGPAKRPKVTFMTWDFGGQVSGYRHACGKHFFYQHRYIQKETLGLPERFLGLGSVSPCIFSTTCDHLASYPCLPAASAVTKGLELTILPELSRVTNPNY